MIRLSLALLLATHLCYADEFDPFTDGFDETPVPKQLKETEVKKSAFSLQEYGIEGKLKQEVAYSYRNDPPHDKFSSLRTTFFLEYNQELWDSFKLKVNGNSFYDFSYLLKGKEKFTNEELDALEYQVELFDAYIQGTLIENLDLKLGRQVVVWGKSDTIRVVDILNPLDSRRPAMVDIEDLRLPTAMAKFDYYYENWSITPIFILEQREDKLPPFGGDFNPMPIKQADVDKPNEITYALNISAEFSGFDLDLYYANVFPNFDFYPRTDVDITKKVDMYGAALNYVYGSLLLKSELAYFKGYKYTQLPNQSFDRSDLLIGFEYNGIADTTLSLDLANRHFMKDYGFDQNNYQGAFRITSDFLHDTLHLNYLLSMFGAKFDSGGYQRVWGVYDISDSIKTSFGLVYYIGGNTFFDAIDDNDMIFWDISYSF